VQLKSIFVRKIVSNEARSPRQNAIQVATKSVGLRFNCNNFNFGCGSAPEPTGGAYSATPDSQAVTKEQGKRTRREILFY